MIGGDNVDPAQPKPDLADLSPAYFGLVMATGIVSLAAFMMEHSHIAFALFYLNIAQYALLCVLYGLRAWRYPRRFFGDMVAHLTGPGYFTMAAGTGILASQFLILDENVVAGGALWLLAILLWIGLIYTIFVAFTVRREKPTLDKGISGSWLLAVVATQALAVSSALLAVRVAQPYRLELNLLALSMWLWSGMLYIWMMSLIFYRYAFFRFSPGDLSPPYWINMGAMAISTLAGSLLILNAPHAPFLTSLLPFLKGFHRFLLGDGNLVDTHAAAARGLAPRLRAFSAPLRSALLGSSVPARHVCCLHLADDSGDGLRIPLRPASRVPLDRAGSMGDHVSGHAAGARAAGATAASGTIWALN